MNRRDLLRYFTAWGFAGECVSFLGRPAHAAPGGADVTTVLHDPDSPQGGNPKGDVTIVVYFDYNCPFCKKSMRDMKRFVAQDRKVRIVYKDWPILAPSSMTGAKLALAAKYQGKYQVVHDALMAIPHGDASEDEMREAAAASGVNMARLAADVEKHNDAITALLQRNAAQAQVLDLPGTPVYLIGPLKIALALEYDGFAQATADARAELRKR
ncbi:DsbA family protein [Methylovirgula sp. 4M-Z18]|uniref:DsbA family protein n=1 Tax=Methylovirgula sp. 4M-Z18 TaxID=2293567 RepID=UPI000E2EFF07|nr:DsbA family protein [Methylovirgula sp. 4M-Z18]RFB76331.1 DsbA family protein [Methylovirgula sp. 4M-Z18]